MKIGPHKIEPVDPIPINKETSETSLANSLAIGEAQLILAEKRTSLAVMRTGIAVFALPLSVLSILIATSRYYDFFKVLHLMIPLMGLNLILIALGMFLILRSIYRMRHYDQLLANIKKKYKDLSPFMD